MPSHAPAIVQYLGFVVRGEEFALPILRVVEIVEYAEPSRVPNAPPFLHGVVGVRGATWKCRGPLPIPPPTATIGNGSEACEFESPIPAP